MAKHVGNASSAIFSQREKQKLKKCEENNLRDNTRKTKVKYDKKPEKLVETMIKRQNTKMTTKEMKTS